MGKIVYLEAPLNMDKLNFDELADEYTNAFMKADSRILGNRVACEFVVKQFNNKLWEGIN